MAQGSGLRVKGTLSKICRLQDCRKDIYNDIIQKILYIKTITWDH